MTLTTLSFTACSSFLVALAMCHFARRFAERRALFDHPNDRSLHTTPIPRLGGVGVALGAWAAVAALLALGELGRELRLWLFASIPVAGLGLIDDVRPLRAGLRFVIQIAVSAAFCLLIGVPTQIAIAQGTVIELPFAVALTLSVVWIVAVLNIFNFMDGMDGLAGAQSVGVSLALAIGAELHGRHDLAAAAALMAASSAGFLVHNAPPAKIFMGDAGSTFLGFSFATLALVGARGTDPVPFFVVPLALAPFLLDGTFTIFRRLSKGEAIWRAHRSHLYQRAVATGLSHHDVLVPYVAWMGVAAATSIAAAQASMTTTAALIGAVLLGLVTVWRWVLACERTKSNGN